MFSVARRLVCCDADAEDIVQDVLLRFWLMFDYLPWEHPATRRDQVICRRWIRFRAAELRRKAHCRWEIPFCELPLSTPCRAEERESYLLQEIETSLSLQQLKALLSPQQHLILSHYLSGDTHEEIARRLNVCVGTVKHQFFRIRHKAQAMMSTFSENKNELTSRGGETNAKDSPEKIDGGD
ncbi:MAG: sigma-70 family RNA polymerase sigma factor [Fimbriimonadales bacterium]|nr:sigma-70 family RNA polymerase sigma factor [Fimbriimonadales bacterium]